MKYLIITGIFALGISLGYVVGTQGGPGDATTVTVQNPQTNTSEEIQVEEDEDHEKPAAELTLDSAQAALDSLEISEGDTTFTDYTSADSISEEDLSISREKLIRGVRLPIIYLSMSESKDTVVKDLLGIEEVQAKTLFAEFWESPLNYEGYKLSKKKLIVYGMSPQFDYKVYKRDSDYYFAFQDVYYKMKETQDFLPFVEVSKSEVFND